MLELLLSTFDFLINRPLILLVLLVIPLRLAARWLDLFPSRRWLYLAVIPALLSVALMLFPADRAGTAEGFGWLLRTVLLIDGLLILAAVVDAVLIVKAGQLQCRRQLLKTASQGKKYEVEIELTNRCGRGCWLVLQDDLPESFVAEPERFETRIPGASRTRFTYDYMCHQRGMAKLNCVHLQVDSPLGLWKGIYRVPEVSTINVYPDMQQISEYDLLARTNRLSLMGVRRSRKIGQDNEFERLRDYTQDDNYKHIDWRSTARRQKLTVRDFQANQSQRIILMLDCGRMMTGDSGDKTLLDHSINAMLMLSYVALRQGDAVGLITFSDHVHNFTPAKSGVKHINRLLQATYNLKATSVESRYDDAFLYLRTHCRKRSLVVLLTNVIDDINAVQINQYLRMMSGHHLPLGVLMRDHDLYSAMEDYESRDRPSETITFQAAAAANVLAWRHQVIRDLHHHGVLALDLFPEQLTSALVNQYLEIKARHLL